MTTVIIDTTPSSLSVFSTPDTIFEICITINLNKATVYMGKNTVLRFIGGSFDDGYIRGYHTSVESLCNHAVFDSVELSGEWNGAIHDLLFSYDANSKANFSPILTSLFCFEKIDLYREKYYLKWTRIAIDTPQDIELDGHGAVWYISSDKGDIKKWDKIEDPWGPRYITNVLISYYYYVRGLFRVRNLTIQDNSETSGESDFGEVIDYSPDKKPEYYNLEGLQQSEYPNPVFPNHLVYTIFEGLASSLTEFDNVRYDGGGEFLGSYNLWVDAEKLVFRNCDLHTGGFAVEVLNLGNPGSLKEAVFDNCIIHNHLSRYVGVLSFVSAGLTKQLRILNSTICGYPGNLEVFGIEHVMIDNTVFINHGLCSEYHPTIQQPQFYTCTNSQFYLTAQNPPPSAFAFSSMGDNVLLKNCFFYMTRNLLFCNIKRLHLYDNTFVVPMATEYAVVIGESVRIGYYRNNRLSCSWVSANHHISPRVDTPYVLAQYEPFRVAFYNDIEVDTYHYGCDWSMGLKQMDELNGDGISLSIDSDGYAGWTLDTPELTTDVINDTVTISLVGKAVATSGPETDLVFCEINEMLPFWILSSPQSVFRINLFGAIIADIPRSVFSPQSQDVRIDVTITQVNGYLDFFVFVNRELYTRHRRQPVADFSPTRLTFSPNDQTKVRLIRFIPGGFILDEPQSFNDWQ